MSKAYLVVDGEEFGDRCNGANRGRSVHYAGAVGTSQSN
jgi:hypothetical protein